MGCVVETVKGRSRAPLAASNRAMITRVITVVTIAAADLPEVADIAMIVALSSVSRTAHRYPSTVAASIPAPSAYGSDRRRACDGRHRGAAECRLPGVWPGAG